jgi:putative CocE/NonD family hydrolase
MMIFASWMDAGTGQGAIERFRTVSNRQRVFIGAWSHGAGHNADPFAPSEEADPSAQQRLFEALRFFDHHLRGTADPLSDERRFYYATLGESGWKSTATWPPAGFSVTHYYLNSGQTLGPKQGGSAVPVKLDVTSTGERNRWHTQLTGKNVVYTDVLPMMQSLTAFTGIPLDQSVEITGQPVLRLRLHAMREDPSLLAYLVVIDSHNRPIYLSEGHLRLIHRKLDASQATLHTYLRRDASPVRSEEEIEAVITLLPVSALVPTGSRLRLLLAAADDADFPGTPYSAVIEPSSRLELPLKARPDVAPAEMRLKTPASPPPATPGKPNFSGTWKLKLADSDYSDPNASKPDSLVRTVKQTGDSLSYKVEREKNGEKTQFQVDLKIGGAAFESKDRSGHGPLGGRNARHPERRQPGN